MNIPFLLISLALLLGALLGALYADRPNFDLLQLMALISIGFAILGK